MLRGYMVFVFSVCLWVNIYFVSKISQELLYLESWNFVHMTSMTSCIMRKKIGAVGSGHLELFPFVVFSVCLWVNIYFVSKISQELLNLESWNFVHMTSMTSCIVGKKIGVSGSGHLELFPFVVFSVCLWVNIYRYFLRSGLWAWWAKLAYQVMLTIRGHLITSFAYLPTIMLLV